MFEYSPFDLFPFPQKYLYMLHPLVTNTLKSHVLDQHVGLYIVVNIVGNIIWEHVVKHGTN